MRQFGNDYTFPRKFNLTCVDQINFSKLNYTDAALDGENGQMNEFLVLGSFISNTTKSESPGTSLIDYDGNSMDHKVLLCLPGHVKILMPNELDSEAQRLYGGDVPSQLQIYEMNQDVSADSFQIQSSEIIITDTSGNTVRVSESQFD